MMTQNIVGQKVSIMVMGKTGSGKSTFVNLLSGSSLSVSMFLDSCTRECQVAKDFMLDGKTVSLIDTAPFDGTDRTEAKTLKLIAAFLTERYQHGMQLHGIVYLHRITDIRMDGMTIRMLRLFRELCGTQALMNVVIVTNMWDKVALDNGERRETELKKDPEFFKPLLNDGAKLMRHDGTLLSAERIIHAVLDNRPQPLLIQTELVDERRPLAETSASKLLIGCLEVSEGRLCDDSSKLERQLRAARKERNQAAQVACEAEKRRISEDLATIRSDLDALRAGFEIKKWNEPPVKQQPKARKTLPPPAAPEQEALLWRFLPRRRNTFQVSQRNLLRRDSLGSLVRRKHAPDGEESKLNGKRGDGNGVEHQSEMAAKFLSILAEPTQCRRIFRIRGIQAQKLLDLIESIANEPGLREEDRWKIVNCIRRLSKLSGLYPGALKVSGDDITFKNDIVATGGFADILQGTMCGKVIALKSIRTHQVPKGDRLLKSFYREGILWSHLSHPNILPVYGFYQSDRPVCLISPWMDYGDVNKYLKGHPMEPRALLALDVARGISYLHEREIVHGDLKGSNVLVTAAGRACVSDFGLSIVVIDTAGMEAYKSTVMSGGTPRWQAPELFDDVRPEKTNDVYAWGYVAYEIFTGEIPFKDILNDTAVIVKVSHGERPLRPHKTSQACKAWGLTDGIWKIITESWTQDPKDRLTIREVVERMESVAPQDHRPLNDEEVFKSPRFRTSVASDMTIEELETLLLVK